MIISEREKKLSAVWAGLRDIAVHDDDTSPLTTTSARTMNAEFVEFVAKHADRLSRRAWGLPLPADRAGDLNKIMMAVLQALQHEQDKAAEEAAEQGQQPS